MSKNASNCEYIAEIKSVVIRLIKSVSFTKLVETYLYKIATVNAWLPIS